MQLSFPIFTVLFLLAAASGMGIGGGGLLVVYLTVIHASDQASAQAFNLLFFIIAATTSAIIKYKKGSIGSLKNTAICSALAIPGIFAGTALRNILPIPFIRTMFGVMLILTGAIVLFREIRKKLCNRQTRLKKSKKLNINHQ